MQTPNDKNPLDDENIQGIGTASPDQTDAVSVEDEERAMLLANTELVKGEQLKISLTGEIYSEPELRDYAVGHVTDPENMYEIYYKGIDKLLKRFLPKGPGYKADRDMLFEEKNTFLTRGHRIGKNGVRGADGRMGHIVDAEMVLNIIIHWAATSRRMADLYQRLLDLNIKSGYGLPA